MIAKSTIEQYFNAGISAWEAGDEEEAEKQFAKADEHGSMKAGRYLGVIALKRAAERGDITSKVILGTLYEYGYAVPNDNEKAKEWYRSALADDHPNRDGFNLAAGADLGMGRLLLQEGNPEDASKHLNTVLSHGEPHLRRHAERWSKT